LREEGRRKKEEGRRKKEEGRGKREEGRGKREKGRRKKNVLSVFAVAIIVRISSVKVRSTTSASDFGKGRSIPASNLWVRSRYLLPECFAPTDIWASNEMHPLQQTSSSAIDRVF
jgi:hypothetical protein